MAKKETKTPEVETVDTFTTGIVDNCFKLNIREKPSCESNIISVVNADTVLTVNKSKSVKDWFHITTMTGSSGYCMKKYITIKQ